MSDRRVLVILLYVYFTVGGVGGLGIAARSMFVPELWKSVTVLVLGLAMAALCGGSARRVMRTERRATLDRALIALADLDRP